MSAVPSIDPVARLERQYDAAVKAADVAKVAVLRAEANFIEKHTLRNRELRDVAKAERREAMRDLNDVVKALVEARRGVHEAARRTA